MKKKKDINIIAEVIYFIGIILLVIHFFIEKNTLIVVDDKFLNIIFCVCFILKIFLQKYTKKQLALTLFSAIISIYVSFIVKEYVVFYLFLVIFASKNIDLNRIIKVLMYSFIFLLSCFTIIYILNLMFGVGTQLQYRVNGRIRHSFYFNHPNLYSGLLLWVTAMYIYLRYEKIKIIEYVVIIIINFAAFYYTDSKTSIISFVFMLFLIAINKSKIIKNQSIIFNIYNKILKYIFIICGLLVICTSLLYTYKNNDFFRALNNVSSQRVSLVSLAIQKYNLSLFPRNLDFTKNIRWDSGAVRELIIDSIYARITIKYGLIYLIYISYFSTKLINSKTLKKDIPFILLFSIVCIMEKYLFYPVIGFPLLFYKRYLWDE